MKSVITRVEKHLIKRNNDMWVEIDKYCFLSKEIYNKANYIVRETFLKERKWIRYYDLDKKMREHEIYYMLGSQNSQQTLRLLEKNWISFFKSIKIWSKNKGEGYLSKPNLPNYKKEDGRNILMLTSNLFKIKNEEIYFSWKPLNKFSGIKTNVKGRPIQIRFVPMGSCYYMEIVYEVVELKKQKFGKNIIGIDLGVNNFATISNNIGLEPIIINGKGIKSINQYYSKNKSKIQERTGYKTSKRLNNLAIKQKEKSEYFLHCVSKYIIKYCLAYGVDTIVIGLNEGWKQNINIGKKNNQIFTQMPHTKFIEKIKYKCENHGINFIVTEESYTSGTSFLDKEPPIKENYNNKRRIKRGLFRSNNGILINADLNASYQIIKKVFPKAFLRGRDRGCGLHPIRVNL